VAERKIQRQFNIRRDAISIVLSAERDLRELGIDVPSAITPKKERVRESSNGQKSD
jgi:hypothetical protein